MGKSNRDGVSNVVGGCLDAFEIHIRGCNIFYNPKLKLESRRGGVYDRIVDFPSIIIGIIEDSSSKLDINLCQLP